MKAVLPRNWNAALGADQFRFYTPSLKTLVPFFRFFRLTSCEAAHDWFQEAASQIQTKLKRGKMSLIGTYTNNCTGDKLQITDANDSNGVLAGKLTTSFAGNPVTLSVSGHYHFISSTGPATSISLLAVHDDNPANIYEAWAATGASPNFPQLTAFGGRAIVETNGKTTNCSVEGSFTRQ
jgi:hypothetical protein